MKADISDAPERVIRKHPKNSIFYTAICLMIGSLATVGALQLFGQAQGLDSADQQKERLAGGGEELSRVGKMPPRPGLDPSWLRASSESRTPNNPLKQTVFNDQDFISSKRWQCGCPPSWPRSYAKARCSD